MPGPADADAGKPDLARRLLGVAGLLLLASLAMAIIDRALDKPWRAPAPAGIVYAYGAADYAAAMAAANRQLLLGEQRVRQAPQDWTSQESLAHALLARARLSGSFHDLARADQALATAMASAAPGSGPLLTAAVGAMAVHRLAPVPALLATLAGAAVPADRDERSEAMAVAGDRAFYAGDYAGARRLYDGAARLQYDAGVAIRLANWHQKHGEFAAALAQIGAAMAMTHAPTRVFHANLLLQKGGILLTHGDWPGAEASFAAADRIFPGNWRAQAMRAQMLAVRGDTAAAVGLYRAILARMAGAEPPPEVIDALAALYRASGDGAASRVWADRAAAAWADRLALLPAAAAGHALEHELVFGTPARALVLARQNVEARPHGDTLVMLARALVQNGDPAAAVAVIATVDASGWRSADQYVVLSQAQALLGHGDAAEAAQAKALAINPRAFDPAASLLWFGNH